MSQRSPQRRASTPPRRGRSPSRTPSRQLDVEVQPVNAGGLVYYSRYIVPIFAVLASLVVATLVRVMRVRPQRPASIREDFGVTLRPKGGLPGRVARREVTPHD